MIHVNSPKRFRVRRLIACAVLVALVAGAPGVSQAQNYDAVAKRLDKAVKKGEITRSQADAMLATLKKSVDGGDRKASLDKASPHPKSAKKVEKVPAVKKSPAVKKDPAVRKHEKPHDLDAVAAQLKAAVKAGKLTEKEAAAKWEALTAKDAATKKGNPVKKKDSYGDLEAIGQELKAAVKAGKLTEDEAWAKWKAIVNEAQQKKPDAKPKSKD